MKFLIKQLGLDHFIELVEAELKGVKNKSVPVVESTPNARVRIIAPIIRQAVRNFIRQYGEQVTYVSKSFQSGDLAGADLVIAATNIVEVNLHVQAEAKKQRILVNAADTPDLCDFYIGSIVTRGDLKVTISTNGKSPTFAKRFRQLLEEVIPDETSDLLDNLRIVRDKLKGNFEYKVKELNKITESPTE